MGCYFRAAVPVIKSGKGGYWSVSVTKPNQTVVRWKKSEVRRQKKQDRARGYKESTGKRKDGETERERENWGSFTDPRPFDRQEGDRQQGRKNATAERKTLSTSNPTPSPVNFRLGQRHLRVRRTKPWPFIAAISCNMASLKASSSCPKRSLAFYCHYLWKPIKVGEMFLIYLVSFWFLRAPTFYDESQNSLNVPEATNLIGIS